MTAARAPAEVPPPVPGLVPVPVDRLPELLRGKVDKVRALGGDTRFFEFAGNAPEVVGFYWGTFYRDLFFQGRLPIRLKELVRLRLAGLHGCPFCQVGDAASAREHGVSQEEIDQVLGPGEDGFAGFPPRERLALIAAGRMAYIDPDSTVDESTLRELAEHFAQAELVELFVVIGVLTGMARMLAAVGFMERACPIPGATPVTPT